MGWLIAAIIVVLLLLALKLARVATRLDRLHRRTEAAWAALDVALAKRSGAARAVAASPGVDPVVAATIATAARATDAAARSLRADAENELTKALELLPTAPDSSLANEMLEASQRILLARRFYNDAVRDTRALRAERITRLFRLAGRAKLPEYFEIAEYHPHRPLTRVSARVLLLDPDDRVLLFRGADPHHPDETWWFTPGGGVEAGEDLIAAARRELAEETGVQLGAGDFTGPLWWRRARFWFTGIEYEQTEYFFVARPPANVVVSVDGFTDVERASISGHAWWHLDDLRRTDEKVYPVSLPERLPEAVDAIRHGWAAADPAQID